MTRRTLFITIVQTCMLLILTRINVVFLKGIGPAAGSPTATLLRLHSSRRLHFCRKEIKSWVVSRCDFLNFLWRFWCSLDVLSFSPKIPCPLSRAPRFPGTRPVLAKITSVPPRTSFGVKNGATDAEKHGESKFKAQNVPKPPKKN